MTSFWLGFLSGIGALLCAGSVAVLIHVGLWNRAQKRLGCAAASGESVASWQGLDVPGVGNGSFVEGERQT